MDSLKKVMVFEVYRAQLEANHAIMIKIKC